MTAKNVLQHPVHCCVLETGKMQGGQLLLLPVCKHAHRFGARPRGVPEVSLVAACCGVAGDTTAHAQLCCYLCTLQSGAAHIHSSIV